jgi:EAL and modified HD-GYP domain-containing signal transduction protein
MPAAFIARQPILDANLKAVGYELLFRGRGYAADALIDDPEQATATVLLNAVTELDLKRIVGNRTAWINVSREFVLGGLALAIPPGVVGLEIPEDKLGGDDLLAALQELKRHGHKLALDDFRNRPESGAVLELFDVVKLNTSELDHQSLAEQVERLRPYPALVLADKLGTRVEHEFCVEAGCDLFQGYFFCRPAMVGTRGIDANRLALLQVVAALNDPAIELEGIEQLIVRDVGLSFRLLRYVNSAFFGLRGQVRSIGQALALLGVENVQRWATLSVLASVDNKPTELTLTALIRARFCELAAVHLGFISPAEGFTLGLFSVIDGMMDAPMHDVAASLPLADDMREALVLRRGPKGQLLDCVTSLEAGDGEKASGLIETAGELYLESLIWANGAAESLFGQGDGGSAKSPGGPVHENARRRTRSEALATSAPPPSVAPPAYQPDELLSAPVAAARGGVIVRFLKKCLRVFGRRSEQDLPAADLAAPVAPEHA